MGACAGIKKYSKRAPLTSMTVMSTTSKKKECDAKGNIDD
jgi:hypothetical protein